MAVTANVQYKFQYLNDFGLFFSSSDTLYLSLKKRLERSHVTRIIGPANFRQFECAGVWPKSPGYLSLPVLDNIVRID